MWRNTELPPPDVGAYEEAATPIKHVLLWRDAGPRVQKPKKGVSLRTTCEGPPTSRLFPSDAYLPFPPALVPVFALALFPCSRTASVRNAATRA
jgi:hypothetical protein